MASFDPRPASIPRHFEISRDRQGRWIVRDREGLVGGVFLTREGALRFALGEVAGDPAYVHICAEPAQAPPVARRTMRTRTSPAATNR